MELITIIIIGITVLFTIKGFNDQGVFNRYKFQPRAILNGKQYDRMFASGFLHVDYMHLLFNMLTLYFFANVVISFFANPAYFTYGVNAIPNPMVGYVMFLVVYIASILAGNLLALFFHKDNAYYSAVGASGGVSGILFASIVAFPHLELRLFFAIPIKGWIFGILYLGYSVYGMQKQLGNIGHEAHLGGAIVGLIAPLMFFPAIFEVNKIYILGMLVPIVVMFVLALKSKR